MTKVHGKRYAYKFDFQGLAAATQPAAADPAAYKYQSELFMSGYGHAKLNLMPPPAASVSVSVPGGLFQSASSYWSTSPGANLYAGHHTASGHVPPHLGTYPHYAWPAAEHWGALGTPRWDISIERVRAVAATLSATTCVIVNYTVFYSPGPPGGSDRTLLQVFARICPFCVYIFILTALLSSFNECEHSRSDLTSLFPLFFLSSLIRRFFILKGNTFAPTNTDE